MITLAVDTTAQIASVAVLRDGRVLAEYTVNSGNTHSVTLLPMIKHTLETVGLDAKDVDLYALSAGPGSFTGVRIGAATLKGLAFAYNKPCVAVSTLEAMAENLRGLDGVICPVINARRGQVYGALFESKAGTLARLTEDDTLLVEELPELLSKYDSVWFTGDAYPMVREFTNNITPDNLCSVSAAAVAKVGERIYNEAEDKSAFTDTALLPVYLKKPQAEREREERLKKETN